MGAKNKVELILTGDAKGATRAFKDVDGAAHGLSGKLSTLGGHMLKVGGLMAGALAAGLVGAGAGMLSLVDDAAKLQQNMAKANTVFGDSIGVVEKWAGASANAMGLTKNQAVGLAASFGDLLVPMGFTREQAAAMSTDVVGLSGALAAWTGGTRTAAEVSDILAKAMLGERDGLKELGISISDADVKERLKTMGMQEATGAALQQATAIATQQLIMEKSGDAQTAFADKTRTIAERMLEVKAKMGELKDHLVTMLMPAFESMLGWISANMPTIQAVSEAVFKAIGAAMDWIRTDVIPPLVEAFNSVKQWIEDHQEEIKAAWQSISDKFGEIRDFVVNTVVPELQASWDSMMTWWNEYGPQIVHLILELKNAFSAVVDYVGSNWGSIKAMVWKEDPSPKIGEQTDSLKDLLSAANGVVDFIRTNWPTIGPIIKAAIELALVPMKQFVDTMRNIAEAAAWALKQINLLINGQNNYNNMHKTQGGPSGQYNYGHVTPPTGRVNPGAMAAGGDVLSGGWSWVGEKGPELLNLPKGAQVRPLDRAAGASITVNVYNAGSVVAENDIVRSVIDGIRQAQRLNGAVFA